MRNLPSSLKVLILSATFLMLFCLNAVAQHIVTLPKYRATNARELTIDKIILSDTATIFYFSAQYWPGNWFRISSESYLQAGDEKLKAKSILGMPFDKEFFPKDGKVQFELTFPPVKPGIAKVDYMEGDCDACFKITDIELVPQKQLLNLPIAISGNWYNTDGNKEWISGFYENKVVYNNKVWDYSSIKTDGLLTCISIKNGPERKVLFVKAGKPGQLYVGSTKKNMVMLAKNGTKSVKFKDNQGFATSVFKIDSAVYKGYIKGYSPKLGYKTGLLYVDNIITGNQDSFTLNINPDGSFYAKIPMNYPEEVYLRMPNYAASVYLEPGKTLFECMDFSKEKMPVEYMGNDAELNYSLDAARDLANFNYDKLFDNNPDFDVKKYKSHVIAERDKNLIALDNYRADNSISKKAYELVKMNIIYTAACMLMDVNMQREQAYRQAHAVQQQSGKEVIVPVKLDLTYLSFLKGLDFNSQTNVLSNAYNSLLNRLKYADVILTEAEKNYMISWIKEFQKKAVLTDSDKKAINLLDSAKNSSALSEMQMAISQCKGAISKLSETSTPRLYYKGDSTLTQARVTIFKNLSIKADFSLELMHAQDETQMMSREFISLTKYQLADLKKDFTNLYVYNTIENYNTSIKNTIEENKHKTGYGANETPKTAADSIFSAIIKKYRGKVVFVDFWATWCVPCRMSIKEIAPLKEELKDKDIVFLYITNTTSPIAAYNNMIPDIKGEHYRVNTDEWNVLSTKFNIGGIPHYTIVNKNGEIVNNDINVENNELKKRLLEVSKN